MGKRVPICNMEFLFTMFMEQFQFHEETVLEPLDTLDNPDETDYLMRGERLETLARTIYRRQLKKLTLTEAESKVFSVSFEPDKTTYFDLVHKISKAFVRPCLRSMERCDDEYAQTLLSTINSEKLSVTFSEPEEDAAIRKYARCGLSKKEFGKASTEKIVCVTLHEEGFEDLSFFGFKNLSHSKKDLAWRYEGNYMRVVDLADFLSSLIIYAQVMKHVNACFDEVTGEMEDIYDQFLETLQQYANDFRYKFYFFGVDRDTMSNALDALAYPLIVSRSFYNRYKELFHRLEADGVRIESVSRVSYGLERTIMSDTTLGGKAIGVCNVDYLATCFLLKYKDCFPYHMMLLGDSRVGDFYWGLPSGATSCRSKKVENSYPMELFTKLFFVIASTKMEQKQTLDYYREIESATHAKSYQLKKTISERVLSAMRLSLFNKYFGFVEFDDETDISKVEEISKEFRALKEKYLQEVDSSENAIRFRKLGNHKALGLYYPSVKCLCVDIHSPQSLVHEYGHLIDYTKGDLSAQREFRAIKSAYVSHLREKMRDDESFNTVMKGATKYNFSYYSRPTEIFARCFELFVSKVLGVRNSIVPDTFSDSVYPQSEEFLQLIAPYFNDLLKVAPEPVAVPETVRWLVHCPASDHNFIAALAKATIQDIKSALQDVSLPKTKVAKLNAQLKRLCCAKKEEG